jgi:hypothetical protein
MQLTGQDTDTPQYTPLHPNAAYGATNITKELKTVLNTARRVRQSKGMIPRYWGIVLGLGEAPKCVRRCREVLRSTSQDFAELHGRLT